MAVGLGICLEKTKKSPWPVATWAIVSEKREAAQGGAIAPPRSYDEPGALRHLHERITAAAREHGATTAVVWEIEGSARLNNAMRPRLRAEGVVVAAVRLVVSSASLAMWQEIRARSGAEGTKADYESAKEVCGIPVGSADSYAVLAALAALGG